jgi:non-heme Fe2+,alpha-ketoglutarate-dependent halogenase
MNNGLTDQQVANWRRDGFLYPFDMLSADEIRDCQAGLARFEAWLGSPVNASKDLKWRTMPHITLPWYTRLVHDARILDKIEQLIGADIMVFTSTFFIKEAHTPTIAAWHQDSTYYGIGQSANVATAWIALTEASHEAGCMDVLPFESDGPRQMQHVANVVQDSVNRAGQVITEAFDESRVATMALRPGQFSLHHGLCPHRSGPNTTDKRRIGIGMNFIAPSEKPLGKYKTATMLVRGEDRYGNFEKLRPPATELDDDAVAAHERAVTRYRETYYEQEPLHLQVTG